MMEGRKNTELGLLPKDWKILPIDEISKKLKAGGTPSKKQKSFYESGTIPFVLIEDMTAVQLYLNRTKNHITQKGLDSCSAWLVPSNTVLLSMYATVGKAVINTMPVATNQAIIAISTKENVLNEYLAYCLGHNSERLLSYNVQSTQKNVNKGIVEKFKIPIPPIPEQHKIAYILSTLQKAIEQQDKLINHTTELKKALMQKLFTEGTKGEKQKQTEIGLVPVSWEVKSLIDAVEFIDYGVSQAIPKTPPKNGVKIVSTADINRAGDLLYDQIRTIEVPQRTIDKLKLNDGDLLFNWRNSAELIGKSTIYHKQDEPHIFASFILRINCGEKKSHNYFMKYLMNHYREQGVFIKLSRRAVNQANYNRNEISVLKIPIPPLKEQVEIAKIITQIEGKINHHKVKKTKLIALFKTLLHELMTGQRRVHNIKL